MKQRERIFLSSPHMSEEGYEQKFIQDAFDANWIAPLGENIDKFEEELAEKINIKSAVALASGTSAIHLALRAAEVQENDIVLCQSLTFSASANPIIYQHAKPVFIDSERETWNMCPKALEVALKKYPQAKAVIVVNLYGISANYEKIVPLCKKYNVTLIEDAAESLGSFYNKQATGTFGDFGIFSFNGNKIITSSGGGMLVTGSAEIAQKVRFWATQSRENKPYYEHKELGFNYRMSNIVAGIGRGQLKVLEKRVAQKKAIFDYYVSELSSLDGIEFMPINSNDEPNYWLSCCLVRNNKVIPKMIIDALAEENIESRHLWKPMHLQPFYQECDYIGANVAEDLFKHGVCLPSDTKMTEDDLALICSIIKKLWE
ncbi:aminotransferase class I/II-fold pyridoxal phosphate-dependent enzyme [Lentisphaerota bacterium WC36G]|nr:aminotransferase class I/II-fold pyridoxal phosphate-dependent enzyme [Lentisphaerae bacterium WC36]